MVMVVGSVIDCVFGLEMVVDDYVVKLFELIEFSVWIKVVFWCIIFMLWFEWELECEYDLVVFRFGDWMVDIVVCCVVCLSDCSKILILVEFVLFEVFVEMLNVFVSRVYIFDWLGVES